MIGTWTPPGIIITVAFDDETLALELVKKTEIPEDEPISWMAFDVRHAHNLPRPYIADDEACSIKERTYMAHQ
jgi:hypothetical protein